MARPAIVFPGVNISFTAASFDFLAWRERNKVFEDIAAYDRASGHLTSEGEPEVVSTAVAANFFSLLGFQSVLERSFLPEEESPGGQRVVILSHSLWQRKFGGNPRILGKTIWRDRESYTVVGVLPSDFQFPGALFAAGDFKPLLFTPVALPTKLDPLVALRYE